MHKLQAGSFTQ